MIEKDLPVYTYTIKGFSGSGKSDYYEKLRELVEEKKSRMK